MYRFETELYASNPNVAICMDIHSIRPWAAFVAEGGVIRIWDYNSNQIVHQYSMADLESTEKSAQQLQIMAEKDVAYKGPKKAETKSNKKSIGNIKIIKFLDQDIRFMKFQNERGVAEMASVNEERLMAAFAADWPHLLIACGENRILCLDYVSFAMKEIDTALFDNKQVTCIEVFALEDCVAFGCVDGSVRLWNALTGHVSKVSIASNKPIVGLISYYSESGSYLTASTSDGVIGKWRITSSANTEPTPEIKDSKSGYDILDMGYNCLEHHLVLLSDKSIILRDNYNNKDIDKLKFPNTKESIASVIAFVHPKFPSSSALLLSKDGKHVYMSNLKSSAASSSPFANPGGAGSGPVAPSLDTLQLHPVISSKHLSRNEKEKAKIAFLKIHPTNPSLLFVGTTQGLLLLTIDPFATANFALIPQRPNPNSSPSVGQNQASAIYYYRDSKIWKISSASPFEGGSVFSFPSLFASQSDDSETQLQPSPTHNYLSAFNIKNNTINIYSVESKSVQMQEKGVLAFCWAPATESPRTSVASGAKAIEDVFVYLEGPTSPPEVADLKKKKSDVKLANVSATRTISMIVKKIESDSASSNPIATFETTWTSTPKLFAGPLIAVDAKNEPRHVGLHNAVTQPTTIQFYTWEGEKVGIPLPTPLEIKWDIHTVKYCLFVYEKYFCVFICQPRFKLLAKVSDVMLSSLWFNGVLFYTTATDIKCFFAHQLDCREAIICAIPTDAFSSALLSKKETFQEALRGCSIVEITNDQIVLLNPDFKVLTVPLDNPLYQFYTLAHADRIQAAVEMASKVPTHFHPQMASFLESRHHVDAIKHLSLPPQSQLAVFIKHSLFKEAIEVVTKLIDEGLEARQELNHEYSTPELQRNYSKQRESIIDSCQRLAAAAAKAGQVNTVGRVWFALAQLEPSAYRHLALFYAQNGFEEPLRELHKKLSTEANRDLAIKEELKYVAVHTSQALLNSSLQAASNSYAEYIVSMHQSAELEHDMLELWNARIRTELEEDFLRNGGGLGDSDPSSDKPRSLNTLAW